MGWLGWSEEQTLSADVNTIVVAMRGRVAMLQAVFGGGKDDPPASTMTPELFDDVFG